MYNFECLYQSCFLNFTDTKYHASCVSFSCQLIFGFNLSQEGNDILSKYRFYKVDIIVLQKEQDT